MIVRVFEGLMLSINGLPVDSLLAEFLKGMYAILLWDCLSGTGFIWVDFGTELWGVKNFTV